MAKRRSGRTLTRKTSHAASGVHFWVIHAYPHEDSVKFSKYGGYVACWINFPEVFGSLAIAKFYIRTSGWRVRRVKEYHWITSREVPRNALKHFNRARREGACFVYKLYPKGSPKAPRGKVVPFVVVRSTDRNPIGLHPGAD